MTGEIEYDWDQHSFRLRFDSNGYVEQYSYNTNVLLHCHLLFY